MARMSSATSTKKADPTGPLRRSRPNRTPGGRRRAGMLSRRLYDGVGESLDHRGARTLLVVKPESPRELSSALTGRLEISTATTIRHSQPAELDLVEQGGRFSPRGPTRPLPLWTSPQLSPRPAGLSWGNRPHFGADQPRRPQPRRAMRWADVYVAGRRCCPPESLPSGAG